MSGRDQADGDGDEPGDLRGARRIFSRTVDDPCADPHAAARARLPARALGRLPGRASCRRQRRRCSPGPRSLPSRRASCSQRPARPRRSMSSTADGAVFAARSDGHALVSSAGRSRCPRCPATTCASSWPTSKGGPEAPDAPLPQPTARAAPRGRRVAASRPRREAHASRAWSSPSGRTPAHARPEDPARAVSRGRRAPDLRGPALFWPLESTALVPANCGKVPNLALERPKALLASRPSSRSPGLPGEKGGVS